MTTQNTLKTSGYWIAAVLIATMSAAAPAQDAQTYDLRPLWTAGQQSTYHTTQHKVTQQQIQGVAEAIQTSVDFEADLSWRVLKTPRDGAGGTAEMTIQNLRVKIIDPQGNSIEEDGRSSNEATAALRQWINAMVDSPLTVQINDDGTVGKVDGYRAMQQKAGSAGEKIDENYCREMVMDVAVLVGGTAHVKPGDTWHIQHAAPHPMGNIDMDTQYTLSGVQNIAGIDVAQIDRTSKVKFTPDLSNVPANAPPMKFHATEASQSGQILFDMSRHEIVGVHSEQTLDIEVRISIPGREIVRTSLESTSTQLLRTSEK